MPVLERQDIAVSEVHCVREVRLGIPAHAPHESIRFYTELLGLPPWPRPREVPGTYGLGNPRRGLLLERRHDPDVDEVRRRLTLVVPDLDLLEKRLRDFAWPYERVHGLGFSGHRIYLHDPAGHRVEVRQSRPL